MPLLNAIFNNFLDFDYSDWDEDTISTDDDSTTADETNFTEAEVEDGIEMFSSVMRMDMKDWTVLNNWSCVEVDGKCLYDFECGNASVCYGANRTKNNILEE